MALLNPRDVEVHERVFETRTTRDLDPVNIREICWSLMPSSALMTKQSIEPAASLSRRKRTRPWSVFLYRRTHP